MRQQEFKEELDQLVRTRRENKPPKVCDLDIALNKEVFIDLGLL